MISNESKAKINDNKLNIASINLLKVTKLPEIKPGEESVNSNNYDQNV